MSRESNLPGEPASFTSIAFETGRIMGRAEAVEGLKRLRVLRDSMIPGFLVIYTEDGATDITLTRLLEALRKAEE